LNKRFGIQNPIKRGRNVLKPGMAAISTKQMTLAIQNGSSSRTTSPIGSRAMLQTTKILVPTGGVNRPTPKATVTMVHDTARQEEHLHLCQRQRVCAAEELLRQPGERQFALRTDMMRLAPNSPENLS
jgi:hypothetical protein